MMTDDRTLETLLAKQDIHDTLMRYCFGIDRGDLSLILSAFHEDALDNHSGVDEKPVERFTRTVGEAGSQNMLTSHNLGNIMIQVDGLKAKAMSYFTASHRFPIQGVMYDWVINGRYVDQLECRDGDWRISHRTVAYDTERFTEVVPKPTGHPAVHLFDHAVRGSRTKEDPFYRIFNL